MKYLIAGGGTGGHIYPALAIAWEIKNRDPNAEILYVGTEKGLESELVPREGFTFKTIRVMGLPRKIGLNSLKATKELFLGLMDANKIIKEFMPDVVVGTGGYVCGPVVYMAAKKRIPTLIHEQNVFPGITNKILAKYVNKILVTFEESQKYFKYPEKVIVTGNPIRDNILKVDKKKAYIELNINPDIPFILSFGGSGGQKKLNDAMFHVIKKNTSNYNIQILHITGKRFYHDFINRVKKDNLNIGNNIRIMPYFYEMPKGLNIADLVITSAGAITLAEISAIGIASILIPKGYTAENHQEYNARAFEREKASHVILEKDLTGENLNVAIEDLIKDKKRLKEMANRSRSLGKIDATKKIVDIIEGLIG